MPKLFFLLRTAHCSGNQLREVFDSMLRAYLKSSMWTWTTTNGFKLHCLSVREGWGSAVLRCWHHQLHWHLLFSNPFSPTVSVCWKTSPSHPLRLGGPLCPAQPALPTKNCISRRHGISQWQKITKPWSCQEQLVTLTKPISWLLHPPTREIGRMHHS